MKIQIPLPDLTHITSVGDEVWKATAMPYLETDAYEPLWSDLKRNRAWVKKFIPLSQVVGEWQGNSVYHFQNVSGAAYYYVLDGDVAVYAVRYKIESVAQLNAVCQTSIWRDVDHSLSLSVATWVFFKKLLPKFGSILSDKVQSKDGKSFWIRRSTEALRLGLNVYLVDMQDNSIHNVEGIDLSSSAWTKRIWSTTDKEYQNKRLLITEKKLD